MEEKRNRKQLERENQIKDEYLSLIVGYGFDYDGYYDRETKRGNIELMADLIDIMVDLAKKALINDDKSIIYTNFDKTKKWNILSEEILNNEKV